MDRVEARRGAGSSAGPGTAGPAPGRLALPLLAGLAGLLAALPTIAGGFVWDDRFLILQSPLREHPERILSLVSRGHGWGTMFATGEGSGYYRPLASLLHGILLIAFGPHPLPFHVLSVLLHAGGAFLLARALATIAPRAAWGAVLFAVHPALADAFGWISAAPDLLAAALVFLALGAALRPAPRPLACAAWLSLAFFAKESGGVAFAWIPILLWAVARRSDVPRAQETARWRPVFLSMLGAGALYTIVRMLGAGFPRWVTEPYPGATATGAVLTGNLLLLNLARILFPAGLSLDPPTWAIAGSSVVSGAAGLVLGIASSAGAAAVIARGRAPLWVRDLALGVLLAIAALLPVLQIVPTNDLYAGRFLVLPVAGLSIGVGLALSAARRPFAGARGVIAAVLALALLAGAVRRGLAWRNEEALFRPEVSAHPEAVRARLYWSGSLLNAGRIEEARPHVADLARRLPGHPWVRYQEALLAMNEGNVAAAERTFDELARTWRRSPTLLANLAACRMRLGRLEDGLALLDEATRDMTPTAGMRNNRGIALRLLGRPEEARRELERAVVEDPSYRPAPLNLIPLLLHDLGDLEAAQAAARGFAARFPDDPQASRMRGLADSLAAAAPGRR